jgi:hypothetical protein
MLICSASENTKYRNGNLHYSVSFLELKKQVHRSISKIDSKILSIFRLPFTISDPASKPGNRCIHLMIEWNREIVLRPFECPAQSTPAARPFVASSSPVILRPRLSADRVVLHNPILPKCPPTFRGLEFG